MLVRSADSVRQSPPPTRLCISLSHMFIYHVHTPFGNTTSFRFVYVSGLPELRRFISWASDQGLRGKWAKRWLKTEIPDIQVWKFPRSRRACSAIAWSCRNPTHSGRVARVQSHSSLSRYSARSVSDRRYTAVIK